jgi:hypothetical protein
MNLTRGVTSILAATITTAALCMCASFAIGADDSAAGRSASGAATLKRIFASWKERADRVKGFHFTWDTRVGIPKGGRDPLAPAVFAAPRTLREIKYSVRDSEMWVVGKDYFRTEYFIMTVHRDGSFDLKSRRYDTFDGTNNLELILRNGSPGRPMGFIRNLQSTDFVFDPLDPDFDPLDPRLPQLRPAADRDSQREGRFENLGPLELRPLPLCFRPFEPVLQWSAERTRIVTQGRPTDGLVELERRDEKDRVVERCWADRSRNDVIVAAEIWNTRGKIVAFAVDYQRDKTIGWVPSHWSVDMTGTHGKRDQLTECTVTKYAINELVTPDKFLLTFPAGTLVYDRSLREFFVQKDGSMRFVPRGKGRPTYEQLLKEDDTPPVSVK